MFRNYESDQRDGILPPLLYSFEINATWLAVRSLAGVIAYTAADWSTKDAFIVPCLLAAANTAIAHFITHFCPNFFSASSQKEQRRISKPETYKAAIPILLISTLSFKNLSSWGVRIILGTFVGAISSAIFHFRGLARTLGALTCANPFNAEVDIESGKSELPSYLSPLLRGILNIRVSALLTALVSNAIYCASTDGSWNEALLEPLDQFAWTLPFYPLAFSILPCIGYGLLKDTVFSKVITISGAIASAASYSVIPLSAWTNTFTKAATMIIAGAIAHNHVPPKLMSCVFRCTNRNEPRNAPDNALDAV